ncbi:MAG: terminase TerL endonuclease subunit [Planctomycetota bacterium]
MKPPPKRLIAAGLKQATAEGWADLIRDDQDRWALAEGCRFVERFADHAVRFFERGLVHATGRFSGRPFILQPWQRGIVRRLFGWRRPEGSRRYRTLFCFLPKKNGKTTFSAGLLLYVTEFEPDPTDLSRSEPANEAYVASTSMEVGKIAHREMAKLVRKSPLLRRRMTVHDSTRRIVSERTGSFTRVLPHKAESAEGMIAGAVLYDEIHAMKSTRLYGALRYSGASRTQPLGIEITTAGIDQPGLMRDRYRYAKRVRDQEHKDTEILVFIAEGDPELPIDDPDNLTRANPSVGETIQLEDLVKQARDALAGTANDVAQFKRYRLNLFVGAEQGWIRPEQWDRGQAAFDVDALQGRPCYGGLDLAKVSDFSSLCLLWPPELPEGVWLAWWRFWIPEAQVRERMAAGDMSYRAWADEGLITVTPGDTTDHQLIRRDINAEAQRFNILKLGVDRNFEGWQFTQDLFNDDELPAVGIGQGWRSQDVPMQRIEALVKEARLNGGGNPVMRWMVGNAIAKQVGPNGNYHLDKSAAADKVDGVAALVNAKHLALAVPEEDTFEFVAIF